MSFINKSSDNRIGSEKFLIHKERTPTLARLVLFPFSGGSAQVYKPWFSLLPDYLEVFSAQMPGHGHRMSEPLCETVDQLVDDMIDFLCTLSDQPLFFFGHSLGACVAYECCKRLHEMHQPLPKIVFISASKSPDSAVTQPLAVLSDKDFLQELNCHGGIPEKLLGQPEILEYFLPSLRADMALFEAYHCEGRPLPTSLILLGGKNDSFLSFSQLYGWTRYFHLLNEYKLFSGGHFYINEQSRGLIDFLVRKINSVIHFSVSENPAYKASRYIHDQG